MGYHPRMQHALIVEDLPRIRDWLADVARAAFPEVQVSTAGRVDQALARVAERRPDADGAKVEYGELMGQRHGLHSSGCRLK